MHAVIKAIILALLLMCLMFWIPVLIAVGIHDMHKLSPCFADEPGICNGSN